MNGYVVYTEIHANDNTEKWYYGLWSDRNIANEVALELGNDWPVYHCVCTTEEARSLGIHNLPW